MGGPPPAAAAAPVAYRLQLDVVAEGMDGDKCWFHPRAGAVPGARPIVVLTMQKWNVKRSDVFYAKEIPAKGYFSTVMRGRFDGTTLRYVEHGTELFTDIDRGFVEPSLTRFGGRYFLTLRNDRAAYVARILWDKPNRAWNRH